MPALVVGSAAPALSAGLAVLKRGHHPDAAVLAERPVAGIGVSVPRDQLPARREALTAAIERARRALKRRLGGEGR